MHTLWQDVRYGLRMLAKNPGFTLIAILTLALGIGANTAIFSLLNQVLLRRLPVRNPEELVVLKSPGPKRGHVWSDGDDSEIFSYPLYKGLAKNTTVFDGVLARYPFSASIASHGQTDRGSGELVTGSYFQVLGVQPAFGRVLSPADDDVQGAHPVVVLSHAYWTRHFGGDAGVLNQTILVNNSELTIVGVAQAGFTGIQVGQMPDIFVPMTMKGQMTPIRNGLDDWNDSFLAVLARRKPGVSLEQAQTGINVDYPGLLEQQAATLKMRAGGKDEKEFLGKKIVLSAGSAGKNNGSAGFGTGIDGAVCDGGAGFADCVHQRGKSVVGQGGGTAAGICHSFGARRDSGTDDASITGRKLPVRSGGRGAGADFGQLDNEHFDPSYRF